MNDSVAPFTEGRAYRADRSFLFLAWLLFFVVRALTATYRYRFFGIDNRQASANLHPKGSIALGIWHENILAGMTAHRGQPFCPMVSPSKDGELVTFVGEKFGFEAVRGSTSRRGLEALSEIDAFIGKGKYTGLAVDGPRGPRRLAKSGIVDIARRTGVAVLPFTAVADRYWVFHKSWDRFRVPKPFARVAIRYGTPIIVPRETVGTAFGLIKRQVTAALNGLEEQVKGDLNDLSHWNQRP